MKYSRKTTTEQQAISAEPFDRHEVGRTLEPRQRAMMFEFGAEIANRRRVAFNDDAGCEIALAMLHSVNWKSVRVARALAIQTRNY
jgi:hypothetical protein